MKLDYDFIKTHQKIINQRLEEIGICKDNGAYLASIILIGSTIEGLLLLLAEESPKLFNTAKSAPKDKRFSDWKLFDFINVAYELGYIAKSTKKFAHDVRDFRNFIHPNEQIKMKYMPNENSAEICYRVFLQVIDDVLDKIKDEQSDLTGIIND